MLQIPSIKMRTLLIRYMIENFQASTARFIIQEQVGEVTLGAIDVECIFNLENQGLYASDILTEEGEDIKERVPPQFLSKTSENIVTDNLIEDIIKSKATDDDFLRKVVLVLSGTIIAPMSSKIVPKQYYALVDDVKRISKINWNAFTMRVLLDCLRIVKKGKHLRQWPKGNLALLQYLYWEKVQPVEGECAYNPNLSIQPLMRNWTEGAATRRDRFDYDNGRGRGNVRRLLEKLNKSGVMYKPAAAVPSADNDVDEELDSFENGPYEKKEFVYKDDIDSRGEPVIDMTQPDEVVPNHKTVPEVIDAYMGHLELRVGHDRYLCPAWRSKFLVDRAIARDDPLSSSCNMDSALSKAGAVNRVTNEYTVRDKTYIALNIDNAHWMTVVMHLIKQEFQVLDSLYPLDLTEKTVKALRMAIAHDMHLANLITPGKYPDVSKWPIKEYDMPQQEDG
ncbi:hypothetical protein VPH35_100453 [Triticum aestivum]